ncbi:MAG: MFS transporter [Syntrophorhabdaceae bacterium]
MEKGLVYPRYRWLILMSTCLVFISYAIDMIAYAPIFTEVAKDLKVDMGVAIQLSMAFAIALALGMILGGPLVDRYGITIVFTTGLLCASLPATLMPWLGSSYGVVFTARLVQGAVGMVFGAIGPILALWFPEKEQGLAGGLILCCLSIGPAVGVVASPALYAVLGSWQYTVALLSLPGWFALFLALVVTRRPPSPEVVAAIVQKQQSSGSGGVTYSNVFRYPMTWIGTGIVFFNSWGIYGLYNLIPPYLAAAAPMGVGLGPAMAGTLTLLCIIAGIPAFIVGGLFFDRVAKGKSKPAIFIGFVMSGLFSYIFLIPSVFQNMTLLVFCLVLAGWGVSFMGPSLSAFIAINYPSNLVGSMVGWWFGFGTVGGALGIFLAGVATGRTGSFYWAIAPIALASVVGILLTFMLKPAHRVVTVSRAVSDRT